MRRTSVARRGSECLARAEGLVRLCLDPAKLVSLATGFRCERARCLRLGQSLIPWRLLASWRFVRGTPVAGITFIPAGRFARAGDFAGPDWRARWLDSGTPSKMCPLRREKALQAAR